MDVGFLDTSCTLYCSFSDACRGALKHGVRISFFEREVLSSVKKSTTLCDPVLVSVVMVARSSVLCFPQWHEIFTEQIYSLRVPRKNGASFQMVTSSPSVS